VRLALACWVVAVLVFSYGEFNSRRPAGAAHLQAATLAKMLEAVVDLPQPSGCLRAPGTGPGAGGRSGGPCRGQGVEPTNRDRKLVPSARAPTEANSSRRKAGSCLVEQARRPEGQHHQV